MNLCLADDLTGLVELATLCANQGLCGEVYFSSGNLPAKLQQALIFINLACRDQNGTAAYRQVKDVLQKLDRTAISHLYLKLDSAARGPLAGMLKGILDQIQCPPIPLLLANPDTERFTRQGIIWIGNRLLQDTAFAHDPLHPMAISSLPEILTQSHPSLTTSLAGQGDAGSDVIVLDGGAAAEISDQAVQYVTAVAAAGAAPFGVELLRRWCPESAQRPLTPPRLPFMQLLMISGTQHPTGVLLEEEFRAAGGNTIQPDGPLQQATLPLLLHSHAMHGNPRKIGDELARATAYLIEKLKPSGMLLTGGETAQSVLATLGIHTAQPVRYAHSVAELQLSGPHSGPLRRLWLKPGSYGQGGLIRHLFACESASGE